MTVCVLAGLLAAGCDSGSADKPPAPDLRPVADGEPYLCDLVPEGAFRIVTGLDIALNVRWAGPQKDDGLCLAHAKSRSSPLGIHWSYNDGDKTVGFQYNQWTEDVRHPLPADLGKGLAIPTASDSALRPNYVIGVFSCGKKRPWISIDFAPVVRGRDAVRDMVDFMRIAERRFGEIHKCTPRPS
ncbi:hypothetical protein [Actinomadura sp. NEAU-AAG7]|uniref:hypothetical protein n=1 Tax=Actinomadura sp. NEAU-AAG7 TaxID=2839640 RepID=UPI001BE40414|nr:hypothetical protein [Actinomadura sp. NEAU-AAG7]MBT2210612.1 hypothetical protein [Actinomadura sp. NEAU-AAG7]